MELVLRVGAWLKTAWSGAQPLQRAMIVVSSALLVVTLAGVAMWAIQPRFEPVTLGLSDSDSARVAAKLKDLQVKYRVGPGGIIEVPSAQAEEIRLQLTSLGLLKGGRAAEALGPNDLMATSEERRQRQQQALMNDLAANIEQFEGVERAEVKLAKPEPSLYAREQAPTTASVLLQLAPGVEIKDEQVSSIQKLVANSVPELIPENVFITDTLGRSLTLASKSGEAPASQLVKQQLQAQHDIEERDRRKLQTKLDQMFGPGKTHVSVTAELDFTQVPEYETRSYKKNELSDEIIRAMRIYKREEYEGGRPTGAGGTAGAASNIGSGGGSSGVSGDRKYSVTEEQPDVLPKPLADEEYKRIIEASPKVLRRSVSVAVDSDAKLDQNSIEQIAMGTLGLETATGPAGAKARDTLLVVTAKFDKEYQKKAEQQLAAAPMQRWVQGWMMAIFEFISPKLIGTVFLLVIAMMLLKWMGKGAKRAAAVFQTAPGGAMIVEAQGKFVDRPRSPEQGTEEEPVAELQVKSDKAVEAVGRFAKERPEAMALLLKGWMSRD